MTEATKSPDLFAEAGGYPFPPKPATEHVANQEATR